MEMIPMTISKGKAIESKPLKHMPSKITGKNTIVKSIFVIPQVILNARIIIFPKTININIPNISPNITLFLSEPYHF